MTGPADSPDDRDGTFASPPCLMHEFDPAYAGLIVDDRRSTDVAR